MSYALFEDVLNPEKESSYLFLDLFTEVCIYDYSEVSAALAKIEALSKDGYYLAGYIAYDSIFGLEPKISSDKNISDSPLIHFRAYNTCKTFASKDLLDVLCKFDIECDYGHFQINQILLEDNYKSYQQKFKQIQKHLVAGDSYQVNLTLRGNICFQTDSIFNVYYHLSRYKPVEYAALLPYLPNQLLSFSPELFFHKSGEVIRVKPMKGTAPRSNDTVTDEFTRNWLANDNKNRAENLIIVDLLRNDLSRFCETGTIKVNDIFKVEEYSTVFQMVSEISARVNPSITFYQIIRGLFPCGSITGAPKISTMQIIDSVESSRREAYCGAVGFILPNNDMHFNVAIRTLSKNSTDSFYQFGVGGGITIQSNPSEEWDEIKTKLKFISDFYQPDFDLIESMLVVDGQIKNLPEHLTRLANSASMLMFPIDIMQLEDLLISYLKQNLIMFDKRYKLRLIVKYPCELMISHTEISAPVMPLRVALLSKSIDSSNPLFQHKTTAKEVRGLYDSLYAEHLNSSMVDELIFINHDGVITESRYFNVIIDYADQLITSPVSEGLLPGVFRQKMLDDGSLLEKPITPLMLESAAAIYLCNDVRGLQLCEYQGRV